MSRVPDWVLDSKLETHFLPDSKHETVHTYYEQESHSRRPIKKTEHWQRVRQIGGGGFGEVWLERCTKGKNHGHHVRATKQMEYERCFVKSFGWYQNKASLFIAMEYLELGDLQDYLNDKNQPLPESEARDIMSQILEGLDLMHDNGFTHRDLKPNIADFGISKRIGDGLGKSTTLKGTPGYIAPELYEFTQAGTPYAVDIWAAGEVMFQILTKQPVFKHPGLLFNYVQTPNVFPSNQLSVNHVSESGVEFVLCLMHPTPAGRMSAKDALQHRWMDQALPHNGNLPTLAYKEAHSTSSFDSMTENFASWNTIKSPETSGTPILKRTEELRTSPPKTSGNETLKLPVEHKIAAAVQLTLPITLHGHSDSVNSVAFSPDSKLMVSGSHDRKIKLWNTTTGAIHKTLEGHYGLVNSVAFSPDGKFVVSGSTDNSIKLWNTTTGAIHKTLEGDPGWVNSVAFSPDGKLLVSGSQDITVKLWNTITGAIHKTLKGHSDAVNSVAFSPDGKLVASGSTDYTLKLWNITTGTMHKTLKHNLYVQSVAFSPDGKFVASGSYDETVKIWNTTTGTIYKTLKSPSYVLSVAFSPNGELVASGSTDDDVKLWNTTTGVIHKTIKRESHYWRSQWATSVAFSPDGKLLASGSNGNTVKLWDAAL
ncbi:uncharacterized protein N7479_011403 [Penicillium vulpinum]|uniref:uncharacterized protein n=1 Tax=Penicillium vulpinum TaxID=29845 RepID=UPI002546709F|nr:uncharacterized protein N7479_011403 [Penicillium vulpinum]KAJ5952990.1 hypothetical protein N7479_011403 [Penicillium vulpinum]